MVVGQTSQTWKELYAEISSAQITSGCFDISIVTGELANENQSSRESSNAGECCSISSSPLAGCSPRLC